MNPALKALIPVVLIVILLVIVFSGLGVVVEAGHVGVLKTLGAVKPEPLREGFHLKKPFLDQVEQVDIRLTASHAQASAASRDLQTVSTQVTTQYSMSGDIAPLTYQRIGNLGKVSATLVEPAIHSLELFVLGLQGLLLGLHFGLDLDRHSSSNCSLRVASGKFRKRDTCKEPVILSCGRRAVRLSCTRRRAARDLFAAAVEVNRQFSRAADAQSCDTKGDGFR